MLVTLFKISEGKTFSVEKLILKNMSKKDYGLTVRGVIKNENGEILILKRHPNSKTDPEMWELPGGKVDSGENFDEALVREIKEETNLDSEIGDFCEAIQKDYPHKRTLQVIMYLNDVIGKIKISDEHVEYMWVKIEDLNGLEISSVLKKVLNKKNWNI